MSEKAPKLTPEQAAALNRFAAANGRNWRSKLYHLWMTGGDDRLEDGPYLRQVRNQQPPTFLKNYTPGA